MSGVAVAAIGAACAVIATVFLHRRRGSGERRPVALVCGTLLIVASVLIGIWLLPTERPPKGEPPSVGLVPPVKAPGGKGFAVGMAVTVHNCDNPVSVKLVANGTSEYWSRYRSRFPDPSGFELALPGTDLRNVRVGMSDVARDVEFPTYAQAREPNYFRPHPPRHTGDLTVVGGRVYFWNKHLNSVVAEFDANWLERRGIGTCYLKLPALTGGLTVLAAQEALGHAARSIKTLDAVISSDRTGLVARYDPGLETTLASTTVIVEDGDVVDEASRPGPDEATEGDPTWVCDTSPPRRGEIARLKGRGTPDILSGSSTRGGAFSKKLIKDTRGTDCNATVVVAEASSGTIRDLLLLGLGAASSLGAAILVETLLESSAEGRPRRRRRIRWPWRRTTSAGAGAPKE
jgi:hypothetical protein